MIGHAHVCLLLSYLQPVFCDKSDCYIALFFKDVPQALSSFSFALFLFVPSTSFAIVARGLVPPLAFLDFLAKVPMLSSDV